MTPGPAHMDLQNRALAWLANKATGRGFRGGLEIPLAEGYVADAAAVGSFQNRWDKRFTNDDFAERVTLDYGDGVVREGVKCQVQHAIVFEAKADLSDLQSTFRKDGSGPHANRQKPIGSLHWLVVPQEAYAWTATLDRVPSFWGVLGSSGNGLRIIRDAEHCQMTREQYCEFCASILWYQ